MLANPTQPSEARSVERRKNLKLRTLFDEAYARIAPFLDPMQTWAGMPLEHLAFHMLRDAYPGLTSSEAHVLLVAAVRIHRARNPGDADRLRESGGAGQRR